MTRKSFKTMLKTWPG